MEKNELIDFILRNNKFLTKEELKIFSVEALLKLKTQIETELAKKSREKTK